MKTKMKFRSIFMRTEWKRSKIRLGSRTVVAGERLERLRLFRSVWLFVRKGLGSNIPHI